ncbi:MAG: hypothetical protein DMD40_10685 [Gemmatimonadetes bacterium]|nr:MAG: hypothetical protein DMD40_10685 [Gemmatimonadota bacterium]
MRARLIASTIAAAVAAPLAAQSPHTLTGNVALVGDYRFRGLSQTYTQPAVQGGVDFTHVNGAYLATWGSNVSGNQFLNGGSLELDVYGGYRWTVGRVGTDLGLQYYWYPGARVTTSIPVTATTRSKSTPACATVTSARSTRTP